MAICRGCGLEGPTDWCSLCNILVPEITGDSTSLMPEEDLIDRMISELGVERGLKEQNELWNIIENQPAQSIHWIFSVDESEPFQWIIEPPPPWSLSQEDMAFIELGPGGYIEVRGRRRLQRGGILPDGSYLSWSNGGFSIDGKPIKIPHQCLMEALEKNDIESVDWRKIILAINVAISYYDPNSTRFGGRMHGNRRMRQFGRELTIHPAVKLLNEQNLANNWTRNMIALANRYNAEVNIHIHKEDLSGAEWLRRWEDFLRQNEKSLTQDNHIVTRTLVISEGRLFLRIRRGTRWKKIQVPADPKIWALLCDWILSPPMHADHIRMRCIQYGLFTTAPEFILDPENIRGVQFFRNIIAENENVELMPERKSIAVVGVSGVTWLVTPGPGPHNSRFQVRWLKIDGKTVPLRQRDNICIVETDELRGLVLGDALGAISLALIDDINSQTKIDTIGPVLEAANQLREDEKTHDVRTRNRLHQELEGNPAEQLVRRATETFPRLWSVLLRLPIGARMRLTPMQNNGPNLRFDTCNTTLSTNGLGERMVIYRMLRNAGWERDQEEEERLGEIRIYRRMNNPRQNLAAAVEEIAEILEPTIQIEGRIRLLPRPVWTYFERNPPGEVPLLPNTDMSLD